MNSLKRISGLLWIVLAGFAIYLMVHQAGKEFAQSPVLDTRIFWYTIIPIFTPIMFGLALFGWYCLKGEYDRADA
jgi:succinate dehydrogenase hydrophobic anchor subunit